MVLPTSQKTLVRVWRALETVVQLHVLYSKDDDDGREIALILNGKPNTFSSRSENSCMGLFGFGEWLETGKLLVILRKPNDFGSESV